MDEIWVTGGVDERENAKKNLSSQKIPALMS